MKETWSILPWLFSCSLIEIPEGEGPRGPALPSSTWSTRPGASAGWRSRRKCSGSSRSRWVWIPPQTPAWCPKPNTTNAQPTPPCSIWTQGKHWGHFSRCQILCDSQWFLRKTQALSAVSIPFPLLSRSAGARGVLFGHWNLPGQISGADLAARQWSRFHSQNEGGFSLVEKYLLQEVFEKSWFTTGLRSWGKSPLLKTFTDLEKLDVILRLIGKSARWEVLGILVAT